MEIVKEEEQQVVIAGGGIAGLATAVALKRVGIQALVLEKSQGLRATGTALTLSQNGWLALDALGVSHKLTSRYAPTTRLLLTNVAIGATQEIPFTATNRNEAGPRISLHRKALLEALADELPKDSIRFSSKLVSIETQTQQGPSIVVIHLSDGTLIKAKTLIGCDGVHSLVANCLGLAAPVNSDRWGVRGLALFPQGHGLNQEIRILVHVGTKVGFIPLNHNDVYWFCICKFPLDGDSVAGNPEAMQREVIENYAKDFPPLFIDIVRHTDPSSLTWAPLTFRHPLDIIFGNLSKGNITVAGDAMHPMTPDMAQGGCAALEDAVVLGRHIGKLLIRDGGRLISSNIPRALDGYVKERRWRVAWLVTASYLSAWMHQRGSQWWMKLFEVIFNGFFIRRIVKPVHYDCGKLPTVSFYPESENSRKMD